MNEQIQENFKARTMSEQDFQRLSVYIEREFGIRLPPLKKIMLESRLQKRVRKLGMRSFKEYVDYIFSHQGAENEIIPMIDLVTTNKTDFFRESAHFDFLVKSAIPDLVERDQAGFHHLFNAWSAGCSTGEEPYTLAIVLSEFTAAHPGFHFKITATDLSTRVLEKAKAAIYEAEKVDPVPLALKRKYLMRSKDREKLLVRIKPQLRSCVSFQRLNLMDQRYPIADPMDIVFFRNVIIYFDRQTQEVIINRICRHLRAGGYLFMGHSETLFHMQVPLKQVAPTVYIRN